MSTRRRRRAQSDRLPPLLVCLIHAAKHAPHDPVDRAGHDAALADLGQWALVRVPTQGVLAPDDPQSFTAIQEIAKRHLQLDVARAEVKDALLALKSLETRDPIESAVGVRRRVLLRGPGVRHHAHEPRLGSTVSARRSQDGTSH